MKFYPPKMENSVPSAIMSYEEEIVEQETKKVPTQLDFWIPFTFNLSTSLSEVDGYKYEIKYLNSNGIIVSGSVEKNDATIVDIDSKGGVFKFNVTSADADKLPLLKPGFSYKIQIAWYKGTDTGYYSTAAIFRVIENFEWDFLPHEYSSLLQGFENYPALIFSTQNGEYLTKGSFKIVEWKFDTDHYILKEDESQKTYETKEIYYDSNVFDNSGHQIIYLKELPNVFKYERYPDVKDELQRRWLHTPGVHNYYFKIYFTGYTNSGLPVYLDMNKPRIFFKPFYYEAITQNANDADSTKTLTLSAKIKKKGDTSFEDILSGKEFTLFKSSDQRGDFYEGCSYYVLDSGLEDYNNYQVEIQYTLTGSGTNVTLDCKGYYYGYHFPIVVGCYRFSYIDYSSPSTGKYSPTVINLEDYAQVPFSGSSLVKQLFGFDLNDSFFSKKEFSTISSDRSIYFYPEEFKDFYLKFCEYSGLVFLNKPYYLGTQKNIETLSLNYQSVSCDNTTEQPQPIYGFQGLVPGFAANAFKPTFEHMYLADKDRQLKIMFNPKVSSFKTNILETKLDTISGKYPFFLRNGDCEYKEFPINGLISILMDENNCFYPNKESAVPAQRTSTSATSSQQASDPQTNPRDLVDENVYNEYKFKMDVLDWLNNGQPKFFRSPTEGSYIVRLMNVSLTPEDTLGRMLHSFSCTAYEIAENTQDNIAKYILNWGADDE